MAKEYPHKYRVYYSDGSVYGNEDGAPELAPKVGVICIVQPDPVVGRHILHKRHFYWWDFESGEWNCGDEAGRYDYMMTPGLKIMLFGRTVSNAKYREIYELANLDPDFPVRSAYSRDEERP